MLKSIPICQKEQCKYTSAKRQSSYQYLFALLGSVCAKAAHKMLVISTFFCVWQRPWRDFVRQKVWCKKFCFSEMETQTIFSHNLQNDRPMSQSIHRGFYFFKPNVRTFRNFYYICKKMLKFFWWSHFKLQLQKLSIRNYSEIC